MKRSQDFAEDSDRGSIAVTYDLAIAKIAWQIQSEEKPRFDNVFVALGAFHVELALFGAFGKVIAESGGTYILNESEVLASGSLKSFHKGKNYKRCKRMHELLALAMEVLHFKRFLKEEDDNGVPLLEEIATCVNEIEDVNFHFESSAPQSALHHSLSKYKAFCEATQIGEHGKTAEFWIKYVNMIHLYHAFSRSVRCGDFELFVTCLPKLANYFFALNHPNYARWIIRYYHNALMLPESHPDVYNDFKNGLFAIKRTTKPFSASPIDLTLEQTINADATSQRTGISSLTNSISARQRWAESHYLRTMLLTRSFEELGMSRKEDVSSNLKPHQIRKDNDALSKVIALIEDTINPFEESLDRNHLFNIATGKAASQETTTFLLSIEKIGNESKNLFVEQCLEDSARFEKSIKRQKVQTFETENGKRRPKSTDGKLIAACTVRDLFGSILCLSLEKKVDMAEVLKFPLTPVPLALSHPDGIMQKTPKSALLKHLESKIESTSSTSIDVTIVDAMFFLHLQGNLPATFGGVARSLFSSLVKLQGKEIHFVCDKWVKPSIKDCERDKRSSENIPYQIKGPEQKRPSNWLFALRNPFFKESLIAFLVDSWKEERFAAIIGRKIVYANCNDQCFKFFGDYSGMFREEAPELCYTHEEADTRMFFHLTLINCPANVVLRTADTDCLIITLESKRWYHHEMDIWLEVGTQSSNTQRYININQLYNEIGESLCTALPGYHAFTGCDYTASFCRKGKTRPLKLLENRIDYQEMFRSLGDDGELNQENAGEV